MSFYKCGHNRAPIFLDDNIMSLTKWFEWKESVGFEGDKSMCFNCYCKNGERKS